MIGYRLDMVEITDPEVLRASGQKFHPIVSPTGIPADEVAGQVFASRRPSWRPPTTMKSRTTSACSRR